MTRALKFAKVDFLKVWRFFYILLFPVFAVLMEARDPRSPAIASVFYCLFASIVLAAIPFKLESVAESGFLQLLPARPGELVLGHFLFGFVTNLAGFALGLLCTLLAHAIHPAAALFTLGGRTIAGFYPALLGVALVFTGAEALMMTVMRFRSVHADQLMRTLPGMVFLIGIHRLATDSPAGASGVIGSFSGLSGLGGLAVLGVCLLAFAALSCIAGRISVARGQS